MDRLLSLQGSCQWTGYMDRLRGPVAVKYDQQQPLGGPAQLIEQLTAVQLHLRASIRIATVTRPARLGRRLRVGPGGPRPGQGPGRPKPRSRALS